MDQVTYRALGSRQSQKCKTIPIVSLLSWLANLARPELGTAQTQFVLNISASSSMDRLDELTVKSCCKSVQVSDLFQT